MKRDKIIVIFNKLDGIFSSIFSNYHTSPQKKNLWCFNRSRNRCIYIIFNIKLNGILASQFFCSTCWFAISSYCKWDILLWAVISGKDLDYYTEWQNHRNTSNSPSLWFFWHIPTHSDILPFLITVLLYLLSVTLCVFQKKC